MLTSVQFAKTLPRDAERPMPRSIHHFKLDARLSADDRKEYERLLLSPTTTVSSLQRWLIERGYHDLSRGAVQRHRTHWNRDVLDFRKQAEAAYHFTLLARSSSSVTLRK